MTIQVTTDNHITGSERLKEHVQQLVNTSLQRFNEQITNVIVHVTDENAHKGQADLRCAIEAHYKGLQPIAAVNHGATTDNAIKGAVDKIKSSLDGITGRLRGQQRQAKEDNEAYSIGEDWAEV